jgi:hypothetical protein
LRIYYLFQISLNRMAEAVMLKLSIWNSLRVFSMRLIDSCSS